MMSQEKYANEFTERTAKEMYEQMAENLLFYPYEKAIAQALVVPVPKTTVEEISYEELQNIKSERGLGALGSSGK
jgi:dUTP pyrophosphatase